MASLSVLDILFPKFCVGCGKWGNYLCPKCSTSLSSLLCTSQICSVCEKNAMDGYTHPKCRNRYALDRLLSLYYYQGVIRKMIKQIKYHFVSDLVNTVVSEESREVLQITEPMTLVPIPLHPSRLRYRGFNQAELLSTSLSRITSLPVRTDLLQRHRSTLPQVSMMDKEKRLANMKGAFTVVSSRVPDKIIFVDDVWTTGATLREAGKTLKKAGAKTVLGITVARA